jgi:hypothetical protein
MGRPWSSGGDIVHVPEIQFEDRNITIKFNVDSTLAAAHGIKLFAEAGGSVGLN